METRNKVTKLWDAGHTLSDIAAELGLEIVDGTLLLPGVWADDGQYSVAYSEDLSPDEAAQEYVDGGEWGPEYEYRTFAHEIYTWREGLVVDADGCLEAVRRDRETHLITRDPVEPKCTGSVDGEHNWNADFDLVGGCLENPGVWGGSGCSISTTEICLCCGMRRNSKTSSQGAETVHDHDVLEYVPDDSAEELRRLVDFFSVRDWRPYGLAEGSLLADALAEREAEEAD